MTSAARRSAVVLAVVALVFVALGRPIGAVAALGALVVVAQLTRLAPDAVDRTTRRIGEVVGHGASVVLLTPIHVLLISLPSAVLRLLGLDPLGSSSGWRRSTAGTGTRPERSFAQDRARTTGGSGRPSWRVGLALVLAGALTATAVITILDREDPEGDIPQALRGATYDPFDSAALAGLDWTEEASAEFGAVSAGLTYTSYVGNSLRDHAGQYVNVTDRVRRSYEPQPVAGRDPIDVWFFGSSMMFGFSAQRDMHTIPSEVVRLAEADGLHVRARNYGSPGYVNFQETVLFAELLAGGERPDLVVFYDGINDTAVQFQYAFGAFGDPGALSDLSAHTTRQALAGVLTGSGEPPAAPIEPPPVGRPPTADGVIAAVAGVYGQGVDLARALADQYELPVLHFWQPDLFNKAELVPGEVELVEQLGMDDFRFQAVADISRRLPEALPPGVIDITDAYDGTSEPVMTDQAHTNELGARLVAEAMYDHLATELRRLGDG